MTHFKYAALLILTSTLLACGLGGQAGTAIPAGRPASFDVQTATPSPTLQIVATNDTPVESAPEVVLSLGDAPTHTPDPNATPTSLPTPTETPFVGAVGATATALAAAEAGEADTSESESDAETETESTEVVTATVAAVAPAPKVDAKPDPPLAGGDWDFETEFVLWGNPHGEPCPGARIGSGWTAFVEDGQFGSSCLNENLYQPNVQSGSKSQEITFDFIVANSGVLRTIPTKVGHQYKIEAFAKNDGSISPVEMSLGVDMTGGVVWNQETVEWFPWSNGTQDVWGPTEVVVTATGESMTIFIRGFHPLAEQGGKTAIDNVSITDLGL